MDGDQAGPSRPKRACVRKLADEREIQLLLDSDNEDITFITFLILMILVVNVV